MQARHRRRGSQNIECSKDARRRSRGLRRAAQTDRFGDTPAEHNRDQHHHERLMKQKQRQRGQPDSSSSGAQIGGAHAGRIDAESGRRKRDRHTHECADDDVAGGQYSNARQGERVWQGIGTGQPRDHSGPNESGDRRHPVHQTRARRFAKRHFEHGRKDRSEAPAAIRCIPSTLDAPKKFPLQPR